MYLGYVSLVFLAGTLFVMEVLYKRKDMLS